MSKEKIDLILPEFAFLDANVHNGDLLNGRTVVLHTRTASVFEILPVDEVQVNLTCKNWMFSYENNNSNTSERFIAALHYTFSEEYQLETIVQELIKWYCDYLVWEDGNIISGEVSLLN